MCRKSISCTISCQIRHYCSCGHRYKVNLHMLHFHVAYERLTNAWDNQAFLVKSSTPPPAPTLSGALIARPTKRKDPHSVAKRYGPVAWQEGRSRIKRSKSTPANCEVVSTAEDAGSAGSTDATDQSRDWFLDPRRLERSRLRHVRTLILPQIRSRASGPIPSPEHV